MVARTPPKMRRVLPPLNPVLIRETVKKVDKCMARLQELQYTVAGGNKVIAGVSLSPRSTRGYLRTSLRCKQESLRIKNATPKKSPGGKLPASVAAGEWRRMSLPAMLVGETVGEILQATQFARDIVAAAACKTEKSTIEDPKTPLSQHRKPRLTPENTQLKSKRKKEKQNKLLHSPRLESTSPSLQRARSRINFKVSPPKKRENVNPKYLANRVSPRNKPWVKKTVLFPNPLFLSTDSNQQQKFCRTRSPIISRNKQTSTATPHKFLIKSPPKFQVKIKSPPAVLSLSPTRAANLSKKVSPKMSTASKFHRSFSPSRLANRLVSPLKSRKTFSPSRLANRLVSPLKSRKNVQKNDGLIMSGLKQRPVSVPRRFSFGRII